MASDFFGGLDDWRRISGQAESAAWLVYGGDREQIRARVRVLPWQRIGELAAKVV